MAAPAQYWAVVPAAGLTHAMSGIGEAFLDGVPMLVISGGVRTDMAQGFQLHDVDQQALMRPLTKATFRIESHDEAVATIHRAYRTAIEGGATTLLTIERKTRRNR